MPLYQTIIRERLKVPDEFLDTYSAAVREKFREAAKKFEAEKTRNDGISQCVHLASSVVLRNPEYLDATLTAIQALQSAQWKVTDPATILTVAAIYYLLQYETNKLKTDETRDRLNFQQVRQQFDARDWLVGKAAMHDLGIETAA